MNGVSTYDEAITFLYSFVDYEKNSDWKYNSGDFNLDRYSEFLDTIGNPHEHGRYVHVAGTNGKGSVSAMIASALTESGLRTGLYTSPHLVSFRERIRIDGELIRKQDVADTIKRIKEKTSHFPGLTFFEVWTALAFSYFAEQECDVVVAEVGLGGRLDSTNVITPALSVLTSIALDHRGKLGSTVSEIAREKAGIIKTGVPVVSAPQDDDVKKVIESCSRDRNARLFSVGCEVGFDIHNRRLYYSGVNWQVDALALPVSGAIQFENAAVALTALEVLAAGGFPVDTTSAKRGIEQVKWSGRLQQVSEVPVVIVDGACNVSAMQAVAGYVASRAAREHTVAVVGMCSDKDVRDVLAVLSVVAERFVLTRVDNPRAMNPSDIETLCPGNVRIEIQENPVGAVRHAMTIAGKAGLVLATGSLYLVGEMLEIFGYAEHD
ncbi:bifunctional folylpolyglutamate synthase/dihydrofolate synthase [Candidatus Latescibacterota bacterium]